jgi:putative membrane protein
MTGAPAARERNPSMRLAAIVAVLIGLTTSPATAQIGNPAGMTPNTPQTEPGKPAPHQPNAQDRLFVELIGAGGLAEVSAARSAEKKATNRAVKDFARRIAADHAKANDQLKPLAKAANMTVPEALDPDDKAQHAALDKLSGAAFDTAYMRQQLVNHQKTATILQWQISSGQDAELQRYAMQTLPVVLEHMEMAQAIIAELTGARPQGLAAAMSPSASPRAAERSR